MSKTSVVVLPKNYPARFPDRCVATGQERPGCSTSVWAHDESEGTLSRGWFSVEVPCRRSVRWSLHLRHWLSSELVMIFLVLGSAMAGIIVLIFNWDRLGLGNAIGWAFAFATAVAVTPPVCLYLWSRGHPPWLVIKVDGEEVKYQFLDAAYAAEFAKLNDAEKHGAAASRLQALQALFARAEAVRERLTGYYQGVEVGNRERNPGVEGAEREWCRALRVALDQIEKALATGDKGQAEPNKELQQPGPA